MIANILTISRILCSVQMFFMPTGSYMFGILYLLCGLTDMLDGYAARKLHTESEHGARLDSLADLCFAAVYAVKVLPDLRLPIWCRIWIVLIAGIKITGIILRSRKECRLRIEHSFLNRLTGILIFLLPLTICIVNVTYSAGIVCAAAMVSAIDELIRKTA